MFISCNFHCELMIIVDDSSSYLDDIGGPDYERWIVASLSKLASMVVEKSKGLILSKHRLSCGYKEVSGSHIVSLILCV